MQTFLDAGYLIALYAERDQHHDHAVQHWREFRRSSPKLVTTNLVVAEVIAAFNSHGQHAKAVEIGHRLIVSDWVQLEYADGDLFRAGFEYLAARPDRRYSLTDCVSFVLMQRMRIREALAFDAHFEQAGFVRLPRSSKAESKRTEI